MSRIRHGASTRFTPRVASHRTLQASSPSADVVVVVEAMEAIVNYDKAEDVGTVEEAVEETAGYPKTTHLSNGIISRRRRRCI